MNLYFTTHQPMSRDLQTINNMQCLIMSHSMQKDVLLLELDSWMFLRSIIVSITIDNNRFQCSKLLLYWQIGTAIVSTCLVYCLVDGSQVLKINSTNVK